MGQESGAIWFSFFAADNGLLQTGREEVLKAEEDNQMQGGFVHRQRGLGNKQGPAVPNEQVSMLQSLGLCPAKPFKVW